MKVTIFHMLSAATVACMICAGLWVILTPTGTNSQGEATNVDGSGTASNSLNNFEPPPLNSARGPCPALNTLANHGYIRRDGKGIRAGDILRLAWEVFGIHADDFSVIIQNVVRKGMVHKVDVDGEISFDLDALNNHEDGLENDMSFFTVDFYFEEYARPSAALFEELAMYCRSQNGGADICTAQDLVDYQIVRMTDSCQNNPSAFEHAFGPDLMQSKSLDRMLMTVFQSEPQEKTFLNTTVDLAGIKMVMIDNHLPNDFVTRGERGYGPLSVFTEPNPELLATFNAIFAQYCGNLTVICPSAPQCA